MIGSRLIGRPGPRRGAGGAASQSLPEAASGQSQPLRSRQPGIPVFGGGGISSVALAGTLALQFQRPVFWIWALTESILLAVGIWRTRNTTTMVNARANRGTQVYEIAGAISIGFGTAAAIATSTALGSLVGWAAATAFVGECCLRNLGNRRLLATTLVMGAAPAIITCFVMGTPSLQLAAAITGLFAFRMATAASDLNGLLVETVRAERDSDHRARHDQLTGLLNVGGFHREIELMRTENPRASLTLFFIDLDDFKTINDTAGHQAGDQILRTVAQRLLDLVGPRDIVARIGGDEFVVVTVLDLIEPGEFAAALLTSISRQDAGTDESMPGVTASIGVADNANHHDIAAIMAEADTRLYAAKRAGGAQAKTADEPATRS